MAAPLSAGPVRTVIVDANDISLRGIAAAFAADDRFRVSATIAALDALRRVRAANTDLLIIDPPTPGRLHDSPVQDFIHADVAVLIYTDYFEPSFFLGGLLDRVRGYISKAETSGPRLLDIGWAVAKHRVVVVDQRLAEYFWASPRERIILLAPFRPPRVITAREQEVIDHLAAGLTDSEIAGRLTVSLSTVQTHVRNLASKLGARTRFALALEAARDGLVDLSRPATASSTSGQASGLPRV
jgi:DNA-binding NarL/FixJ family response regulator